MIVLTICCIILGIFLLVCEYWGIQWLKDQPSLLNAWLFLVVGVAVIVGILFLKESSEQKIDFAPIGLIILGIVVFIPAIPSVLLFGFVIFALITAVGGDLGGGDGFHTHFGGGSGGGHTHFGGSGGTHSH